MVPSSYLFRAREEDTDGEPGIDSLLGDCRTRWAGKGPCASAPHKCTHTPLFYPPHSTVGWAAMNFSSIAFGVAISPWHSGFLFHFPVYSGP